MIRPIHASRSHIVDFKHGVLFREVEQRGFDFALDAPEDRGEEARALRRALAGHVDEDEGVGACGGGVEGGDCAGEGEGVVVGYLDVVSTWDSG